MADDSRDTNGVRLGPYEEYVFTEKTRDAGSEVLETEITVQPNRYRRPPHVHPHQEERFVVESGVMGLRLDEDDRLLEAGEEATVEAGTVHTYWNASDEELRFSARIRPALRFEGFIRTLARLDEKRALTATGVPTNPIVGAMVLSEFRDTLRVKNPPPTLQRLLFPAMVWVGRAVGYRFPVVDTEN